MKALLINFCWLKMFRARAAAVWRFLSIHVMSFCLTLSEDLSALFAPFSLHYSTLQLTEVADFSFTFICLWLTGQSSVVPCVAKNLTYYSLKLYIKCKPLYLLCNIDIGGHWNFSLHYTQQIPSPGIHVNEFNLYVNKSRAVLAALWGCTLTQWWFELC